MTLDHGESFYLGIYIDTEKCSPVGNYELGIAYYDCFGYRYMQTFDLIVEQEKDGSYVSRLDYVSRKAMIADPASSIRLRLTTFEYGKCCPALCAN